MKFAFKDKTVVVTGASGDIGRAIALAFAESGANVAVNDVSAEKGENVVQSIKGLGRRAVYYNADISDHSAMKQMAQDILKDFGSIDILVNNAGINVQLPDRAPFHTFNKDFWNRIVDIDLNGIFYCSQPIVKQMVKQRRGNIVNISSVMGIVPCRLQCAFTAAKAGMINLSRAMALELADYNINVNCISPGSILTEKTNIKFYSKDDKAKSLVSNIPLKRPGDPSDISNAVLFLASEEASYITGANLVVDGGWTCGYTREW